jgi:hypothetical protein
MKTPIAFWSILGILLPTLSPESNAQALPGNLSFSVSGAFENAVGQGTQSLLIIDNDLTDGHRPEMTLQDSPAALTPNGPAGSAAFQWGLAADWTSYPYSSSLWFQPLDVANVSANQTFNLGFLHYRNGTIQSQTGASSVDLALQLSFSNSSSLSPITTTIPSRVPTSSHSEIQQPR